MSRPARNLAEVYKHGLKRGDRHPETGRIWDGSKNFLTERAWENYLRANMLDGCRRRARDSGWECTLTRADIDALWPEDGRCAIFPHIELAWGRRADFSMSPSLDRIDSSQGYTRENCQIISDRANRLKRDATPDEILLLADWVKRSQHNQIEDSPPCH